MRSPIKRFHTDTDGGITIEAVLWLPVFIGLLMLAVDASSLMANQSRLQSLASDASRLVSLGIFTEAEAETWAEASAGTGQTFNFDVTQTANTVTTNGSMSFADAPGLGVLTRVGGTIRVQATFRKEPAT